MLVYSHACETSVQLKQKCTRGMIKAREGATDKDACSGTMKQRVDASSEAYKRLRRQNHRVVKRNRVLRDDIKVVLGDVPLGDYDPAENVLYIPERQVVPWIVWPIDMVDCSGEEKEKLRHCITRIYAGSLMNGEYLQTEEVDVLAKSFRWPKRCSKRCYWHHQEFDGPPIPIPGEPLLTRDVSVKSATVWTAQGVACSFACAKAYILHTDRMYGNAHAEDALRVLEAMYRFSMSEQPEDTSTHTGTPQTSLPQIQEAPDWRMQSCYSGGLPWGCAPCDASQTDGGVGRSEMDKAVVDTSVMIDPEYREEDEEVIPMHTETQAPRANAQVCDDAGATPLVLATPRNNFCAFLSESFGRMNSPVTIVPGVAVRSFETCLMGSQHARTITKRGRATTRVLLGRRARETAESSTTNRFTPGVSRDVGVHDYTDAASTLRCGCGVVLRVCPPVVHTDGDETTSSASVDATVSGAGGSSLCTSYGTNDSMSTREIMKSIQEAIVQDPNFQPPEAPPRKRKRHSAPNTVSIERKKHSGITTAREVTGKLRLFSDNGWNGMESRQKQRRDDALRRMGLVSVK